MPDQTTSTPPKGAGAAKAASDAEATKAAEAARPSSSTPQTSPDPAPEPTTEPAEEKEPTYTADYHLDHARAFYGESRHIVAGALALAAKNRVNFTQAEVKDLISDLASHTDEPAPAPED